MANFSSEFRDRDSAREQGSTSEQISARYADRLAPPCLAAQFALVVVLFLSRSGETALLYARLLFTLSFTVYVAALLLRQREEGWSWSGLTEAWRVLKDSAVSAASYWRRNYERVIYYIVIFLYGSALLIVDGRADDRYVVVVSLLAPVLIAMAKFYSEFHDRDSDREQGSTSEQISARYADRLAPPCLAAQFALMIVLFLSRSAETALLYVRLLFTLSSTVYVAALLLRQQEEGWSWSGLTEAWRVLKDSAASAASAASYSRWNYKRMIYYVVIFLNGSALLVIDGREDNRYVVVVSLLAPALTAIVKVVSESRDNESG